MALKRLIGTDPDQVPLNQMLGDLAYQSSAGAALTQVGIGTGTATAPSIFPIGQTDTGIWFPNSTNIGVISNVAVSTSGVERLRINNLGNVGIGTTSVVSGNAVSIYGGNLYVDGVIYGTANTALNASNVVVTATSTNATFYPAFVEATSGNLGIRVDSNLSYNPATDALSLQGNILIQNGGRFGNIAITNTTAATSSSTGALLVAGGVGIVGNLFTSASAWTGNLSITNTTTSTSATTGTLIVRGGVGITGNIIVASGNIGVGTSSAVGGNAMVVYGGNLFVAGNLRVGNTATTIGGIQFSDGTFQSTAAATTQTNVAAFSASNITVTATSTDSTFYVAFFEGTTANIGARVNNSFTYNPAKNTISLGNIVSSKWEGQVIAAAYGGTGMSSYVQGDLLYASSATTLSALNPVGAGVGPGNVLVNGVSGPSWGAVDLSSASAVKNTLGVAYGGSGTGTQFTQGSVVFAGASGVYAQDNANFFWDNSNNRLGLGTASPSQTLDVNGSALIRSNIQVLGNIAVNNSALVGNLYVTNLTATTSTTTGALVVAGGVGIGGNLYVGGNLIINGNVTYINTNVTVIEDPSVTIGTGPNGAPLTVSDSYDRGVEFHYYSGGGDRYGFLGWQNSSGKLTYITNATAGSTTGIYTGVFGDAQLGNLVLGGAAGTSTNATSTSTGALIISGTGGIGVGGNIYVGGTIFGAVNTAINASNVVITATSTNATFYPAFIEATTGNLGIRVDSGITYNPSTDALTAGQFIPTSASVPSTGMYLPSANQMAFSTNSTEVVRIDAGGNLMINATSSIFKFYVAGGIGQVSTALNSLGNYLDRRGQTTINLQSNASIFTANADITDSNRNLVVQNPSIDLNAANAIFSSFSMQVSPSGVIGTGSRILGDLKFYRTGNPYGRWVWTSVGTGTARDVAYWDQNNAYFLGNLAIGGTNAATSSSTGALTVAGGVGISGNAYVGGNLFTSASAWTGNLAITNTTTSTSSTSGALLVAGGVGIAGNLFTSASAWTGNLAITNTTTSTSSTSGALLVAGGVGISGNVYVGGNINVTNTTAATSTTTGSFITSGGAGIAGNVYVGGNISLGVASNTYKLGLVAGTSQTAIYAQGSATPGDFLLFQDSNPVTKFRIDSTGTVLTGIWQGTTIGAGYGGTGFASYTTGDLLYASASNALSKLAIGGTGNVLTIGGGLPSWGTVTNVNVVATTTNATFYPAFFESTSGNLVPRTQSSFTYNPGIQQLSLTGNLFTNGSAWHGNLAITNTTAATSSTSGALTVAGGMGITGNIFVGTTGNVGIGTSTVVSGNAAAVYGGNVFIAGNLRVGNTATTIGGIQFSDGTFQTTASTGGSSATITDDTTTTAPRYINFTSATSGTLSAINTSSTKLIYYPLTGNVTIGGNLTVSNTAGISTFAGNVGIGTTTATAGYILSVNGSIAATTKSFVIPHPTKEGKKLQYASLEGPENGVYLRGKLSSYDRIMLPEYWSTLVDMDTITVDLTPFGRYQKLYVGEITNEHITIEIDGWFGKPFINCYYTVYAERRDVPRLMVEV